MESYKVEVAKLEAPQKDMQVEMRELFRQMFSLVTECNNRKSAQSVIDQKIQMLFQ